MLATAKLSKKEIKDWIELQYEDLLRSHVLIGGFYFTFEQLNDFLFDLIKMERKINKLTNEMNIKDHLITNPLLKLPTTRLEQAKKAIKQEADFVSTKIDTINKFNKETRLPVTYEELAYIYKRLSYLRDEVEHFKTFLSEELNNTEEKDLNCYFSFVNDMNLDIKQRIRGEIK